MKLFPSILAATLMQETEAQNPNTQEECASDGTAFTVKCHNDLLIELKVNKACLEDKYPDIKLTDLRINPTGTDGDQPTDQCSPCTSPEITDKNAPNYCDPSTSFFAYDFNDENPVLAAVTDDLSVTTSLFFMAGNCGTMFDDDETLKSTSIGKSAAVIGDIETDALILLGTGITCQYPLATLEQAISIDNTGASAIDNVPLNVDESVPLNMDGFFEMKASKNGEESAASTVTLGEQVNIGVTVKDEFSSDLENKFYLSKCFATNGEEESNTEAYKFQPLVRKGCMVKLSQELAAAINPVMNGQSLQFKQFAFRESSSFKVECEILLGEKPFDSRCEELRDEELQNGSQMAAVWELSGIAGRRRRSVAGMEKDSEFKESTEYTVITGNKKTDAYGDIIVAHSAESKTGSKNGAACTTAAIILAATTVMIL